MSAMIRINQSQLLTATPPTIAKITSSRTSSQSTATLISLLCEYAYVLVAA
jgi:hypothetical protein